MRLRLWWYETSPDFDPLRSPISFVVDCSDKSDAWLDKYISGRLLEFIAGLDPNTSVQVLGFE